MGSHHIFIAKDKKLGMHVLIRIQAVDELGSAYPPINPDTFNELLMARDAKSLVLAARNLGPMYISEDDLANRTYLYAEWYYHDYAG